MHVVRLCGVAFVALTMTSGCTQEGKDKIDAAAQPKDGVLNFEPLIDGPVVTDRASTGGVSLVDYDGDLDVFVSNQQAQNNSL